MTTHVRLAARPLPHATGCVTLETTGSAPERRIQAFRCLDPETRKLFQKKMPPFTYRFDP